MKRIRVVTEHDAGEVHVLLRGLHRTMAPSPDRDLGCVEEAAGHSVAPRLEVLRRALDFLRRTIRAVRIAAADARIPRPLRWLAALGLAPIPGPFDEALLLVVAVPLALFYREPLVDAWSLADTPRRTDIEEEGTPRREP